MLLSVMSKKDGVIYSNVTVLHFSRPAVCLSGTAGVQKTVSIETAKQLLKENT
jgi:hypothetical protein